MSPAPTPGSARPLTWLGNYWRNLQRSIGEENALGESPTWDACVEAVYLQQYRAARHDWDDDRPQHWRQYQRREL
ncbi:MAG: hypothetical protein H6978_09835 [Gammaproteobacteria bacterium]|nr:hypothetical protein [Gammaproteobacteria bacterium]